MVKRYLIQLTIFVIMFLISDQALYTLLSAGFYRIETGENGGKVNKARKIKADVVVLGSSRAVHHYDTVILQRVLKKNVFNAGCNGQGIPYILGVVDLILHDYTPELFIINVDATSIMRYKQDFDRVTVLAPFIDESEIIRSMIYHRGFFEPVKYISRSFRYNSKPLSIIKNLFAVDKTIAGFEPLKGELNTDSDYLKNTRDLLLDKYKMKLLHRIIDLSKRAGVKVILANSPRWSPDYKIDPRHKSLLSTIEEFARKEKVSYISINQENSPQFHNPSLFYDSAHLNGQGAKVFTQILAKLIIKDTYQPSS